jgi:serine/threonine-protein kinase
VRLRPPVPAGASTAFTSSESSGGSRWIAPVLVGLVAIGLIVAAILFFSDSDDPPGNDPGGSEQTTTTTTRKSVPSIKVGDEAPEDSDTTGR